MTREKAIEVLENRLSQCQYVYDTSQFPDISYLGAKREIDALETALSALRLVSREQVEKVWRGCPYCKEDGEGYVQKFGAYSIQNGELATGHCKSQKIKFCPHCSRPLTDEAVQMVMERLEALHENIYNG